MAKVTIKEKLLSLEHPSHHTVEDVAKECNCGVRCVYINAKKMNIKLKRRNENMPFTMQEKKNIYANLQKMLIKKGRTPDVAKMHTDDVFDICGLKI